MAGQTTAVQNNSDDSKHGCSGCGMLLPASRFSRTQLLQKRDAARCLQCVSGEAPSTSEEPILALASPLPAGISAPPITAARPLLEIARLRALKNLRQLLNSLCAKANAEPPVMAFDRWIARSQLPLPDPDAAGDARDDPLLPSRAPVDAQLVKDLCRSRTLDAHAARAIAVEMAAAAAKATEDLASISIIDEEAPPVVVSAHGPSLWRLTLSGRGHMPHADVSHAHFEKLAALHRHRAETTSAESAPSAAELRTRLYCMLTRYQALGAHGNQCAVPPACFDVLREHLHVSLECFASPMNTRHERYCSLFMDVDAPFGSLGSFFTFHPSAGSYEANPPFEPHTLLAAVRHAEDLLVAADAENRPLSFAFVVPTWEPLPFHHQLERSKWLRTPGTGGLHGGGALRLEAASHAFVDGAQHIKERASDRYRVSSFGTTLAILQTRAGTAEWPVDAALYTRLADAFHAALPSEESAAARMHRGEGDAVSKLLRRRRAEEEGGGGAPVPPGDAEHGGKKRRKNKA